MKDAFKAHGRGLFRFLLAVATILVIVAFLLPVGSGPAEVQAGSGYSTTFKTSINYRDGEVFRTAVNGGWANVREGAGTGVVTASINVYILIGTTATTGLGRAQFSFNTASLPDDCFISSARLRWYFETCQFTGGGPGVLPRLILTPGTHQILAPVIADYQLQYDTLLSDSVAFDTGTPAGWQEFELNQAGLDYINKTGVTKFKMRDFVWDVLNQNPELNFPVSSSYTLHGYCFTEGGGNELIVDYGDSPSDRDLTQNPDNGAVGGGGNSVTAIDWKTVKCAYADEELGFRVTGTAGTPLQLRLVDEVGNVIDQIDDTIRTNTYFYWRAQCALSSRGFVKCIDLLHAPVSDWGYIAEKPDTTELHNYTYAEHTDYPQYDKPFADYIKTEADLQLIHWKTDVQCDADLDETALYSFRLYHLGDSGDTIYNQTLSWLLDNYYENVYTGVTGNDFQAGWRYIIFVFDAPAGFDNKNGLILDIDRPYIDANKGFYQGLIYKNATAEYSHTQTAYCYLKDSAGITITLDKEDYNAADPISMSIALDDNTGGLSMWDRYKVENMRGGVVDQTIDESLASSLFDVEGLVAGNTIADYTLRVTFYKDGAGGCTYDYVHDVLYTVGGGEKEPEEDILEWLSDLLSGWGLDSAGGKWAITLVAMFLAFIVTHKNKILRVVLPLMVFGLALVIGFLDIWVVVLLALGAGVALFFIVRRGFGGGGEG